MRLLSIVLLFFLGSSSILIPENDLDFIDWSQERKLQWDDFLGKAEHNSPHDALSHCGLSMDMSMRGAEITFTVKAVFDRSESWVKDQESSAYLLSHEQLHFDIYERYARELRMRLKEGRFKGGVEEVPDKAREIYDRINNVLLTAQRDYDIETDHSLNQEAQTEWEKKIADGLNRFSDHIETEFKIQIIR